MVIQKDGKLLTNFSGMIPCKRVVIIDGKLLNIVTRIPKTLFRIVKEEGPDGLKTIVTKIKGNAA